MDTALLLVDIWYRGMGSRGKVTEQVRDRRMGVNRRIHRGG